MNQRMYGVMLSCDSLLHTYAAYRTFFSSFHRATDSEMVDFGFFFFFFFIETLSSSDNKGMIDICLVDRE